jgi:hypothetical protein
MRGERLSTDEDDGSPDPKPEPSASGAGLGGPPTVIGADTGGNDDDEPSGQPPRFTGLPLYVEPFTAWLNVPVEDLDLSMRAYNCLRRSGIMTVGQILERSEEELLSLRNFGRPAYHELRRKLHELRILSLPPGLDVK